MKAPENFGLPTTLFGIPVVIEDDVKPTGVTAAVMAGDVVFGRDICDPFDFLQKKWADDSPIDIVCPGGRRVANLTLTEVRNSDGIRCECGYSGDYFVDIGDTGRMWLLLRSTLILMANEDKAK